MASFSTVISKLYITMLQLLTQAFVCIKLSAYWIAGSVIWLYNAYNVFLKKANESISILLRKCRKIFLYVQLCLEFVFCVTICGLLLCLYVGVATVFILIVTDIFSEKNFTITDYAPSYFLSSNNSVLYTEGNIYVRSIYTETNTGMYVRNGGDDFAMDRFNAPSKYPIQQKYMFRYNGEDASMQFTFLTNGSVGHTSYYWTHSGKRVRESDRHSISVDEKHVDSNRILISIYLTIEVINTVDYGHYECVEEVIFPLIFNTPACIKETENRQRIDEKVTKTIKGEYTLHKVDNTISVVHLQPHEAAFFLKHEFHTHGDSLVSYHYTVNNVPFHPSDKYLNKCTLSHTIFYCVNKLADPVRSRIAEGKYVNDIENDVIYNNTYRYLTSVRFCSESQVFGWHKLSFSRNFYNLTKNETEILEFPYPRTRLVVPSPVHSFAPSIDDTLPYERDENDILEKGPTCDIDEITIHRWKSSEEKVRLLDAIVSIIIMFMSSLILRLICVDAPMNYYQDVILPSWRRVAQTIETILDERCGKQPKKYDIYISHSDEDYEWVTRRLVPHLENNLGLTVCLPDRDFHQGQDTIKQTTSAMDDSRKTVVVLTDSYMSDRGCYELQVNHILLPSLYGKERKNNTVMILNFCQSDLQVPLRSNDDVDRIHWRSVPESELWSKLDVWIKGGVLR